MVRFSDPILCVFKKYVQDKFSPRTIKKRPKTNQKTKKNQKTRKIKEKRRVKRQEKDKTTDKTKKNQ